jgi:5'-3' exonuclease
MGIPSFYRHLVKKTPSLIKEKNKSPSVLALDLNCAIYHCLGKLQKKTPYAASAHAAFEAALIKAVISYIVKLRDHVQPTELLYIAVDGVVPMAKIRQQRMRRFKSVWVGAEENKIKNKGCDSTGWDRNAITPGTEFMDKLSKGLREWCAGQKNTIVSDVYEGGEGEQKIMEYLRNAAYGAGTEIVVYGLDADLIVLCLWHHEQFGWSFKLLREDVELKGGVKLNAFGEEQLLYFDIDQCGSIIKAKWNVTLRDYMGAMSFLGNDFVPHGLTLCIRDDGIEILMETLRSTGRTLVIEDGSGGFEYDSETLRQIIEKISVEEELHVRRGLIKKLKMNGYVSNRESESDEEKALSLMNSLPLTWKVEKSLARRTEEGWILKEDWQTSYYRDFLWGAEPSSAVKQWYFGIQWVLDYYTGTKPVDMHWYYPWYLPPLFKDISRISYARINASGTGSTIPPLAQLVMVLPIESYRLLPSWARRLPFDRPEFYPNHWTFFSCGRRQLWECEPMIPMMPYSVVAPLVRSKV